MTDRTPGWVRRYDFRLGDRPAGQVVEVEQANRLTAAAWFVIDGEVVGIDWGGEACSELLEVEAIEAP